MRLKLTTIFFTALFGLQAHASIITYQFTNIHGESTAHFSGAAFSGSIVYDSSISSLIHFDLRSGATNGNEQSVYLPFNHSWDGVLAVYDGGGIQSSGTRNPDGVGGFTIDFGNVLFQFGPTEILVGPGEDPLAKLQQSEPLWQVRTADNFTYDFGFIAFRGSTLTIAPSPVPIPAAAWLFSSALIGLTGLARKRKAI